MPINEAPRMYETGASTSMRLIVGKDYQNVRASEPPPDYYKPRTVTAELPPLPPMPLLPEVSKPVRPRGPDEHGYFWRIRHAMGLYNHAKEARKMATYYQESEAYHRERRRYRKELDVRIQAEQGQRRVNVEVDPPDMPEEVKEYDKAVSTLKKQQKVYNQQRAAQWNVVTQLQEKVKLNLKEAKTMIRTKQESLAKLKAKDTLDDIAELKDAERDYIDYKDKEKQIVDILKKRMKVFLEKERVKAMSTLNQEISKDLEETNIILAELNEDMPESWKTTAQESEEALNKLMNSLQQEVVEETTNDLDPVELEPVNRTAPMMTF